MTIGLMATCAFADEAEKDYGGYTESNPLVIRLCTPQANELSHLNTLAVRFKDILSEKTNGAVQVEIYMGDLKDREIADAVIGGVYQMGVNNTAILANYNKLFDVLDIAYLIEDYDDVYDVMASDVWAEMLGEFSSTGATLLALQCIGFRTISTTEKVGMVHNLAELKDKSIRITEGEIFIEDYEAWGAAPTALNASEIMPALQNGTIDGVDHVPVTLYTGNGQGEYIKNVALFNLAAHFNGLDINNDFFAGLSEDMQEAIREAANEAAEQNTQELQEKGDEYIQKLEDEYEVTFYQPTDEEIQELKYAVEPVY